MSIAGIFRDGFRELKRKSSVHKGKVGLAEKEKELSDKLALLGKKAWDSRLDIRSYGNLNQALTQAEEKGKEIKTKLADLAQEISGLEEKKKAETARSEALLKELETKKEPVDEELKAEKEELDKAKKESDSVLKRLKSIPEDQEKIRKKMAEGQAQPQAAADNEKRLAALQAELDELHQKLPDVSKIIQAAQEKITPLEGQSGRLEADIKAAKDEHKKQIGDLNKAIAAAKSSQRQWGERQKEVDRQQDANFLELGKKLFEAGAADAAVSAELAAAQAVKKDMESIGAGIQTLEGQKTAGPRGAVWKMVSLILLFVVIIAAIAVGILFLAKHRGGKTGGDKKRETTTSLVEGGGILEASQGFSGSPGTSGADIPKGDVKQVAANLEKIIPAFDRAVKDMPRDSFDPRTLADKLDKDPDAIFYWVRDNTSYVPYRGVLRGPQGVMIDRLGNSLDRALLLAGLLESAGNTVRLARASLPEGEARNLLQKAGLARKEVRVEATAAPGSSGRLAGLSEQLAVDPAELRKDEKPFSRMDEEKARIALDRTASQSAMLLDLVGKLPSRPPGISDRDVRSGQDHWWVQRLKDGAWEDLDPTAPEAKPGMALAAAEETFEPAKLSRDLFHKIIIRIVIEQWSDGKLAETVALEHSLTPSELLGQAVVLNHAPLNWLGESDDSQDKDLNAGWKAHASREKEWFPLLKVGSQTFGQSSFTSAGEIHKNAGRKSRPEGVGGLAGGIFGGLSGRESSEEPRPDSCLTAEWLEYGIRAPEERELTIRREIFDLVGPAARAAGSVPKPRLTDWQVRERAFTLLGAVDILPLTSKVSPEFVDWVMVNRLSETASYLRDGIVENKIKDFDGLRRALLVRLESLQGPLYDWALHRYQGNPHRDQVCANAVNIANFRSQVSEDKDGRLVWRRVFDIVNNDVAVRPDSQVDDAVVRLHQGVADTVAEQLTLMPSIFHQNTSYLTAISGGQGIHWRLVKDDQDPLLASPEWPPDVRERIRRDLKAGCALVAPERPIMVEETAQLGWWRVNRQTGQTLGIMDTGFHQEMPEDVLVESETWARVVAQRDFLPPVPPWAFQSFKEFMEFYGLDLETSRLLYIRLLKAIAYWGV